jgi:hypothetical protein
VKYFQLLLILLFTFSCVESYNFEIKDNQKNIVIEALISDKSYLETLDYPSDGRYFFVKLTYTSDVTNTRPEMISSAQIKLESNRDEAWEYLETEPGIYKLIVKDFKAENGVEYKLTVSIPNEETYESDWEKMPEIETPEMGEIGFKETEVQEYIMEANEKKLRTVKGIKPHVNVYVNHSGNPIYYRWVYQPMWQFTAPKTSVIHEGHVCWISNPLYLNSYSLQEDNSGGYQKELFFMPTIRNERIFEDFTLLLIQYSTTKDVFNFWKEMKERNEGEGLNNTPPFNLKTNFHSVGNTKNVYGYFNVVSEQAKRWYFNSKDLSYYVENTSKADCEVVYGPKIKDNQCDDCRLYASGKAVNVKPEWWRKN